MVTTTTADNVLKSYYLDVVSEQLNKAVNPLLAAIKQTSADVWGRDVRKAVRYGISGGIGAGLEDGDLPKASGNRYAYFVSTLKNLYGTIEITDKAIRASANNEGAFVNLLNDEMEGLIKSSAFNFGRMLFGDGSACIGYTLDTSTGSKDTVTVDNVKNLAEGMVVDFATEAGNIVDTGATILTIDRKSKLVRFDRELNNVGNNYQIILQGSKDLEITGLKALFSSKDIYGVNRSENPWMNTVNIAHNRALTEEVILKTLDEIEARSGGTTNFIVCSWDVRRELYKLLSTNKRAETLELEGGYRALSFNGIPVVADRFCPEGTMYLLNTNDFALHQLCDWQWLEGEDGKVLKQVPGKPVYTATLVKYAELMCYRPCGQGVIKGIVATE